MATALGRLPEPEIPAYVQLLPEGQLPPVGAAPAAAAPAGQGRPAAEGAVDAVQEAIEVEAAEGAEGRTQTDQGLGQVTLELRAMLREPAFQVFAECVLEGALLSLVQESAAGDWEVGV